MDNYNIVELLYAHKENGITETKNKYENLLRTISYNVLRNNEDVNECINDTYLKIWNIIPPGRPNCFKAFICKIIRQISIDKYRYNKSEKRSTNKTSSLDEINYEIVSKETVEDSYITKDLTSKINLFIESLDTESKLLFTRKYFLLESTKEISQQYNLKENYVNVKLFRIRKKLITYLKKEGYEVEKI